MSLRRRFERQRPLAVAAVCAIAIGLIAQAVGIPGGLIFGAMLGATAVTLRYGDPITVPTPIRTAVMIGVGTMIGMRVNRDTLDAVTQAFLPAVGAAAALMIGGILIALALRWMGRSPDGDLLATSPGALEVLVSLAADEDYNTAQVAMFHLVRLLLVVLLLPVILLFT